MQNKSIGVVGAGTMGNGIAHVFAQHGFAVTLFDISSKALDLAVKNIEINLRRQLDKGLVDQEGFAAAMERINTSID